VPCSPSFFVAFLRTFVDGFALALTILIFARVILSWVQLPLPAGLARWIFDVTEPILAPIRRAVGAALAGLDISPIVALFVIQILQQILERILCVGI
jgi:YggT family protein